MRELTMSELACVSGGEGVCTPENSGNDIGGVTEPESLGNDLINIYEGLVEVTSHIMERVAGAL